MYELVLPTILQFERRYFILKLVCFTDVCVAIDHGAQLLNLIFAIRQRTLQVVYLADKAFIL